ncbi:MAG: hypothetical protein A2Z72_05480 [Omnitrophica bacterium RBG_13_46_9]|nr:MAG: hypothetical protein A2Z72_05480 [Omnitrophica bacterium RBG_13_46_9]
MIFVTVGGGPFYGFNRLVEAVDRIAPGLEEEVIIQKGCSTYKPMHARCYDYLPYRTFIDYYKSARLVIGHAGAGTTLLSRLFNKPFIVVPRSGRLNEIFDEHQMQMGEKLSGIEGIRVVYDIAGLESAIRESLDTVYPKKFPRSKGIEAMDVLIKDFMKNV